MEKRSCDVEKKSMTMGKAILKLSAYVNCGMLTVHILKARHLHSKAKPDCHPFVQVCLEPDTSGGTKCYTAVNQNAPHTTFNEKFSFELLLPQDSKKRLHVSVWNSEMPDSTSSEFLGSMSFGLNSLLTKNKDIGGWFYLLKEDVGKKKHLPAVLRNTIYGEIGSPLQSPSCPETPLMEPKHTKISRTKTLTDVVIHRDFNGNTTNNTAGNCLECLDPLPSNCDERYFDEIRPHGQVRSFHSSFRLGKTRNCAETQLTTANYSPIVSSKHVRFNTAESMQHNTCGGDPTNLPSPEKSALKSPPMRRSQNPYVLQYRQEIASVEKKVLMNSQKTQIEESKVTQIGEDVNNGTVNDIEPDIISSRETSRQNSSIRMGDNGDSSEKTEISVPDSAMGYPAQFRDECLKATSYIPGIGNHLNSSEIRRESGDSKEIWIDCQSLESTNTTQDSGICDSSSPKSEEHSHRKLQETSFCSVDGNVDTDRNVSVYKDSHLEPSVKCKVDPTKKYMEQFQVSQGHEKKQAISKSQDVTTSSSHPAGRSKLSSASFRVKKSSSYNQSPYTGCESCAVKYYRHLYSPVLGQRRCPEKPDATHTKIYFL